MHWKGQCHIEYLLTCNCVIKAYRYVNDLRTRTRTKPSHCRLNSKNQIAVQMPSSNSTVPVLDNMQTYSQHTDTLTRCQRKHFGIGFNMFLSCVTIGFSPCSLGTQVFGLNRQSLESLKQLLACKNGISSRITGTSLHFFMDIKDETVVCSNSCLFCTGQYSLPDQKSFIILAGYMGLRYFKCYNIVNTARNRLLCAELS